MAVSCPIGFDVATLQAEVQTMYSRVAASPDGEFHFHRGPQYAATLLGYDPAELEALPPEVTSSFAGVGNPHAVARIPAGATVVDVGSGAGTDLLLAARRAGPTGRAIGVDMTDGMRQRAAQGAAACGLTHVDVMDGDATRLPVDDRSVDVVISNGVLNLVPNKERAVAEIARVLKPGGRAQIADIIIGETLPDSALRDIDLWTGWIAGALLEAEMIEIFANARFHDVAITQRFDCFAGTRKEKTARRYGVVGVNLSARKNIWRRRCELAKLLFTGSHGSDDPTRATMPFHMAKGAVEAGHEVSIALMVDAPFVLKNEIRDAMVGFAVPPLKDLMQFAIEKGVRVYVWGGCAKTRGVSQADLDGKNAEFIDPKRYAQLVVDHDRVVTFWAVSCSCGDFSAAANRQFTAAKAAKELKAYRRGRIGPTTRHLRDGLAKTGLIHGTLLDVGGGVGALTFELLDLGITSATMLEASSAYAAAARDEAVRRTRGTAVNVVHGDLLELSDNLPAADVVTLDRVVCCYPSYESLLDQALTHASHGFGLSYPRDRWYVRAVMWFDNKKRARKSGFRTFVHPPREMRRIIERAGFSLARRRQTLVWAVDVFVKS